MVKALRLAILSFGLGLGVAGPVPAQQATGVAFGSLKQDTSLPVEVRSDSLTVNQTDGTAMFSGSVLIVQGEMRLTAAEVSVVYAEGGKGIESLLATGGVTLVNPTDAAEADQAFYTIDSGTVEMTGNVLLTQGGSAMSGERLVIDLKAGTGRMDGRVKTVFQPGAKSP
jgi:lipopolysaccharide export system protein LptA